MKTKSFVIVTHIIVMVVLTTLISCDRYHFSNPLPVDAPNIYQFPKSFRGSWVVDRDTFTITDRKIKFVGVKAKRIVNGIWSNPFAAQQAHQFDSAKSRNDHYLKAVHYDSLRHPHDTVDNYVIHGKKIFNRDHFGSPFTVKGDTIYFTELHVVEVVLGQAGFLRRVGTDQYILNVSENGFWDQLENDGPWWQIALIERTADKKIFIRYVSHKVTIESTPVYAALNAMQIGRDREKGNYYFDCEYTTVEMRNLIELGLFEERENGLDDAHKVPGR